MGGVDVKNTLFMQNEETVRAEAEKSIGLGI